MSAKPIAALFADSHLQTRAWSHRDIAGDSFYSFRQIIDFAIKWELKAVIGAGDLIDQAINKSDPIVVMLAELDRLERHKIDFAFVQGQHEMSNRPWFGGHRWAKHLAGEQMWVDTVCFYGVDYTPPPLLQIALGSIPKDTHVLIAHQVWAENMGSITSPEGNMGDVSVAKVVLTGDYHVYKRLETRGRDGQALTMISPGSTCMQSVDEPPDKFFVVMCDDFTFKKVRLKTRRRLDYHVSAAGDVDTILQSLDADLQRVMDETADYDEAVRKPLLWVDYPHRLREHRARIERAIDGRGHVFWRERPPEPPPAVVERRREAKARGERRAATLLSELPGYLADHNMAGVEDDCARLLKTGDVEGELRRMREEALQ